MIPRTIPVTKEQYHAIQNWCNRKTLKNFYAIYKFGFNFKFLWWIPVWWRPVWRIWRIIRNTWITNQYVYLSQKIYIVDI